ncbi:MAG: P1 family peptidase [Nitrospinota bacterium]
MRVASLKSYKPLRTKVGHATDKTAKTGCTVLLFDRPAVCSAHVAGGAPGTREIALLDPSCGNDSVHGLLLTGGSAFGLAAADGVMNYLFERGIGFAVGDDRVPIVPAAVIYDRSVGKPAAPGAKDGYKACNNAGYDVTNRRNIGAGIGATVGKFSKKLRRDEGGISVICERIGGITMGAVMVVNAVGNVLNPFTGEIIAGAEDRRGNKIHYSGWESGPVPGANTTIGAIVTNAALTKSEARRVAIMAHDGLAKTIYPSHTLHDGDTIFAASTGNKRAELNDLGIWAAEISARAVIRAVTG